MKHYILSIILVIIHQVSMAQNYVWAKSIGSNYDDDEIKSMALDNVGNICVIGNLVGTTDFDPSNGVNNLISTDTLPLKDLFIAKYSNAGNLLWAKQLVATSRSFSSQHRYITCDNLGNIFITGSFEGTIDFDPSASIAQLNSNGNSDIFIAKYDAQGNYIWAASLGGVNDDKSTCITTDPYNNIYISGSFSDNVDFDPSNEQYLLTTSSSSQIFVAKYTNNGQFSWAKHMISSQYEIGEGHALACDNTGNIYVTGLFTGTTDFDPSAATVNLISSGGYNVFLAKYDYSGSLLWAKNTMNGVNPGNVFSIQTDQQSNSVIIGGLFTKTADFDPSSSLFNMTPSGPMDPYIAKYSSAGSFIWAKQFTGPGYEAISSIAINNNGDVFSTGTFTSTTDFDASATIHSLTCSGTNGASDVFITKYDVNGNYIWAQKMSGVEIKTAKNIVVDPAGYIYVSGLYKGTVDFDPSINTASLISTRNKFDMFIAKYKGAINTSISSDNNVKTPFITIYPNPTLDGKVNIKVDNNNDKKISVTLMNTMGQELQTIHYNVSDQIEFSLTTYNKGLYYVKLVVDDIVSFLPIINQ